MTYLLCFFAVLLMLLGVVYLVILFRQAILAWQDRREIARIENSVRLGRPITLQGEDLRKFLSGELQLSHQLYVHIPQSLSPDERGKMFAEPLQSALQAAQLGSITGGGTMVGESCTLDVELIDFNKGVALLKQQLRKLKAPAGTVIEYECGEIPIDNEV